jgi:hypothetical protein
LMTLLLFLSQNGNCPQNNPYRYGCVSASVMMKYIRPMFDNTESGSKKVQLLGISISNFVDESCKIKKYQQLPLPFID